MDNLSKSFFALSGIGVVIAVLHAYQEITETFNSCNLSKEISCGNVFASGDTTIFGIPFYALGLVWFPLIIVLGFLLLRQGRLKGEVLVPVLMVGNTFTVYLWYLEIIVIRAVCPVCVSLYVVNYVLTILGVIVVVKAPDIP